LSFTDNRQDASLQAGHFNDFVEIGQLRSGLLWGNGEGVEGAWGVSDEAIGVGEVGSNARTRDAPSGPPTHSVGHGQGGGMKRGRDQRSPASRRMLANKSAAMKEPA
jgi:hypothetical protein